MPVIVICGVPGAGSSSVAKNLAKLLNLRHFSVGDMLKSTQTGKETERAIKWLLGPGKDKEKHEDADALQFEEANKGNVVIDSKLGIHFLKGRADFCVWLNCSPGVRAIRIAQRDRIMVEDAKKLVLQKERAERDTFKKIYGFDFLSQENDADLVIDTTKITRDDVVEKIMKALKDKGIV